MWRKIRTLKNEWMCATSHFFKTRFAQQKKAQVKTGVTSGLQGVDGRGDAGSAAFFRGEARFGDRRTLPSIRRFKGETGTKGP
jgi:hypothetical protein